MTQPLDGEAGALIEMEPESNHLLVVNVAVSPDHQGQGYGRALLAHAEEFTFSLGLKVMAPLYTPLAQEASRHLPELDFRRGLINMFILRTISSPTFLRYPAQGASLRVVPRDRSSA